MAIDPIAEKPIPFDQLPPEVIPGRGGNPVHIVTLNLWRTRGVNGVKLETILIGARRCTSIEALNRFYQAVTRAADGERPMLAIGNRTRREKNKAVRDAMAELEAAGC